MFLSGSIGAAGYGRGCAASGAGRGTLFEASAVDLRRRGAYWTLEKVGQTLGVTGAVARTGHWRRWARRWVLVGLPYSGGFLR